MCVQLRAAVCHIICLSGSSSLSGVPPWSSGSLLDHRSLPPIFESRRGHIWRLFRLWLHLITFGGRSAHLAYPVHKRGRKTSTLSSSSLSKYVLAINPTLPCLLPPPLPMLLPVLLTVFLTIFMCSCLYLYMCMDVCKYVHRYPSLCMSI